MAVLILPIRYPLYYFMVLYLGSFDDIDSTGVPSKSLAAGHRRLLEVLFRLLFVVRMQMCEPDQLPSLPLCD